MADRAPTLAEQLTAETRLVMSKLANTKKTEGKHIGKCECGGIVRGVEDFGRLWTWCDRCTPTINVGPAEPMPYVRGEP
jgi:hydrogenase maturation factor